MEKHLADLSDEMMALQMVKKMASLMEMHLEYSSVEMMVMRTKKDRRCGYRRHCHPPPPCSKSLRVTTVAEPFWAITPLSPAPREGL